MGEVCVDFTGNEITGLVIDPFGGENDSALKRAPELGRWEFMKQAFAKFKRINMSILLHLRARRALKVQRLIFPAFFRRAATSGGYRFRLRACR